jgi:SAM-dependent methyltransferase
MPDPALSALGLWWVEAFGDHNHIGGAAATRWFLDPLELGPNDVVLDLGCFTGASLRLAARRYRCQGVGIDPDERFLEIARARAEKEGLSGQLRFQRGTAADTGLPESATHVVLSFEAPFDAAEAWRVLKAQGRFCIAGPVEGGEERFSAEMLTHGFRAERVIDATDEALGALKEVHERFREEERPEAFITAVEREISAYGKRGRRYLRWVGRRR